MLKTFYEPNKIKSNDFKYLWQHLLLLDAHLGPRQACMMESYEGKH